MNVHVVTLELPGEIYQQAQQVAQATQRPIEQVVVEWIHPPGTEATETSADLETMPTDQLIRVAQARVPPEDSRRLQELLLAQHQRPLTKSEQREAVALVEQEDLITLRKARALFLLKQRDILPAGLTSFLT